MSKRTHKFQFENFHCAIGASGSASQVCIPYIGAPAARSFAGLRSEWTMPLPAVLPASEYLFVRCGTPGYVAPEVINIKDMKTKYEPICDMFSLGLIFHILLLGVSAFPGKTYNEVLAQNRASNITFEGEEYKTIDSKAMNLLTRMLKKSPGERITATEALAHPYFAEGILTTEEEEADVVYDLVKSPSVSTCDSPLLTSSNPHRKQQ